MLLAILSGLMLSSCASQKEPQEIAVPVAIACVKTVPDAPVWHMSLLSGKASRVQVSEALILDAVLAREHIHMLTAMLSICAENTTGFAPM